MRKLLGIRLAAALLANPILAQPPEQPTINDSPLDLLNVARAATVRIIDPSTDPPLMGSAVLLAPGKDGSVLLLSARHLFRKREQPLLQVDAFAVPSGRATRFRGRVEVLADHPRADLVLVHFSPSDLETGNEVPPALSTFLSICPPDQLPDRPLPVWALGCPRGADPVWQATRITGTTTIKGGAIFVVAKPPVEGESAGPLIDALTGHVLGICSAADRGTGLYGHLTEIHALLAKAGLTRDVASSQEAATSKEVPARREKAAGPPVQPPARSKDRPLPRSEPLGSWDLQIDIRQRPDGSREVSIQSGKHRLAHVFPP